MKHHVVYDRTGKILSVAVVPDSASDLQYGPVVGRGEKTAILDIPEQHAQLATTLSLHDVKVKMVGNKTELLIRPKARKASTKTKRKKAK